LGLPADKKVVLFVSDNIENYRKGFDLLVESLKNLAEKNLYLLAVGAGKSMIEGIDIHYTGTIRQPEYLRQLYAAADLFIIPSREDNLPNTVLESMACGTPVVGFNIGGIPDMVIDGQTGFIAIPENPDDLSLRIMEALNKDNLRAEMGKWPEMRFSQSIRWISRQIVIYNYTRNCLAVENIHNHSVIQFRPIYRAGHPVGAEPGFQELGAHYCGWG
jgi:glycosyltransferase involved in cell wall biosynthesis